MDVGVEHIYSANDGHVESVNTPLLEDAVLDGLVETCFNLFTTGSIMSKWTFSIQASRVFTFAVVLDRYQCKSSAVVVYTDDECTKTHDSCHVYRKCALGEILDYGNGKSFCKWNCICSSCTRVYMSAALFPWNMDNRDIPEKLCDAIVYQQVASYAT